MAVALEFRIGYLIPEFLAHTFVLFFFFSAAGAVASRAPEPFLYDFDDLSVGIKCYLHSFLPFFP